MRLLPAVVCSITCASTVYARPDGSDIAIAKSGPHVETSHSESPSLVSPASPSNQPWNPVGAGAATSNVSVSLSPAGSKPMPKAQQSPNGDRPQQPANSNGPSPGKATSGPEVGHEVMTFELPTPKQPAAGGTNPNSFGLEGSLMQVHGNRDSNAWPTQSLISAPPPVPATTPEIYIVPDHNEAQPKIGKGAPPVPMAMVHSEAALEGPHTMRPGDSILTAGIDPFASSLVLGMGQGGVAPFAPLRPTRVAPPVQGATFAVGGTTYTASIDKDFNIVVASSILKPGGAAATLAGGAAKVSVLPGGALVVDGGILTMSALRPAVTGCVVNINGRVYTARETGPDHQVMIISTATLTIGGPAATLDGQQVSLGPLGLHVGPSSVAAISTMSSPPPPGVTPTPSEPLEFLSGLVRATQNSTGAGKHAATHTPDKTGAGARGLMCGNTLGIALGLVLGMLLVGG